MSVAPDLLLKSAPEPKSVAASAKTSAKAVEARRNEASSFAQVYAKERQAKPAERSEAPSKSTAEKPKQSRSDETANEPVAGAQPPVAGSGNPLPMEPPAETQADTLLLLGLDSESAGTDEAPSVEGEIDPAQLLASTGLTGTAPSAAPAVLTEASLDPELEKLNSAAAVKLSLQMEDKSKAAGHNSDVPTTSNAANALGGLSQKLLGESEAKLEVDLPLSDSDSEPVESLDKANGENAAGRFNALTQALTQQVNPAQRTPLVPGQPVPMQQGGWSEAVVDRVMWLSSQNLKSAEIQLDPAELGRLEVRINMNQDQAQVIFASAHAGVRDALESQMYRLRELFAQQGMNQLDVNVSDQSARGSPEQNAGGQGGKASRSGFASAEGDESIGAVELRSGHGGSTRGLVDYYA